jgi:hypothetical protein
MAWGPTGVAQGLLVWWLLPLPPAASNRRQPFVTAPNRHSTAVVRGHQPAGLGGAVRQPGVGAPHGRAARARGRPLAAGEQPASRRRGRRRGAWPLSGPDKQRHRRPALPLLHGAVHDTRTRHRPARRQRPSARPACSRHAFSMAVFGAAGVLPVASWSLAFRKHLTLPAHVRQDFFMALGGGQLDWSSTHAELASRAEFMVHRVALRQKPDKLVSLHLRYARGPEGKQERGCRA